MAENDNSFASQQADQAANKVKQKAKQAGKALGKKAGRKVKSKVDPAIKKGVKKLANKLPPKARQALSIAHKKMAHLRNQMKIRRRIQRRLRQAAKRAKKAMRRLFIKLLAHLARLFMLIWPYLLAAIAVLGILFAISGWLLNRDRNQRFASYNFQEDSMKSENPYNMDRQGNYVTQAKQMSKGNKMYFVYYAYNAQNSWYVANVKIDPKTRKEKAIDWQDDEYVKKEILGMTKNEALKTELEKPKGVYGTQKLLQGNTQLYQNVIDVRLGNDAKDAVESFNMNTNMLYLLDQSMNRPGTGGTNDGFYFSEQFTKPMFTGEIFNYKSLIDRNNGKWNAKSWVMDTHYRPKKEALVVMSDDQGNALHEPNQSTFNKVDEKKLSSKLKKMHEIMQSAALPGPKQKYYLYEGFKGNGDHPFPYTKDLTTKGYRNKGDTTSVDPEKRSKKEIEAIKKAEQNKFNQIKDMLGSDLETFNDERTKYKEFQKDYKKFQKAKEPTPPNIQQWKWKKVKVTGNQLAREMTYPNSNRHFKNWKEFENYTKTHNGWFGSATAWFESKFGAFGDTLRGLTDQFLHGNHSGYVSYLTSKFVYNTKDGDIRPTDHSDRNMPGDKFHKTVRGTFGFGYYYMNMYNNNASYKKIAQAVKQPHIVYTSHKLKQGQRLTASNDVGMLFDKLVNKKMVDNFPGWTKAWRKYLVEKQHYNYTRGVKAKILVKQEEKAYHEVAKEFAQDLGVSTKSLLAYAAKQKGKIGLKELIIAFFKNPINFLNRISKKAHKEQPIERTTLELEAPNTHSGANLKYTNGVWNYGFGSIIKFAQFPISYAEKIDWDAGAANSDSGSSSGGIGSLGKMKNAKGVEEAREVAEALGKKLHINPKFIFGQMAYETGGFGHVHGLNLSGVKWVSGMPASERATDDRAEDGAPYWHPKNVSEYAEMYGNTIAKFLQGHHPKTAADYVNLLKHGPGGQQYFTDPNVAGYIAGVKQYGEQYETPKHKSQAPISGIHDNNDDRDTSFEQNNESATQRSEDQDKANQTTDSNGKHNNKVTEKPETPEQKLQKELDNLPSGLDSGWEENGSSSEKPKSGSLLDRINQLQKKYDSKYPRDAKKLNQIINKQKNLIKNDSIGSMVQPAKGPGSTLHTNGSGKLHGVQYGYYKNDVPEDDKNSIQDGDQSRFKNRSTLNQHKEYFLTGATTPVGSVDLTKTLYYGRKNLPPSYKPFYVLEHGNHGYPNKDWNTDEGKALHQQKVYDVIVQRKLRDAYSNDSWEEHSGPKDAIKHEFPESTGKAYDEKANTPPKYFRPEDKNFHVKKKADGNAQPNGTTMWNTYHVVQRYQDSKGKWHSVVIPVHQSAQVTLISDAPQIDSKTWEAITDPMIAQFKDPDHGAGNIETSDFSLHGTEYFRQYMMNYQTYIPNKVVDAKNFNLTKEINMFETGSSYESDRHKRQMYKQLNAFFDQQIGKGSTSPKNSKGDTQTASKGNSHLQAVQKYAASIDKWSNYFGVDPDLVDAIIMAESGGNPDAKNPSGAYGLMQAYGTGNPTKVYSFAKKKYVTWTKMTESQLAGHPDKQIYNGVAELAYRLANATSSAGLQQALNGYGGGEQDGWGKYFAGKGGTKNIYWLHHSNSGKNTKYYNSGKSESAGRSGNGTESGSGSAISGIGSAINSMAVSIMDAAKGYLKNFSEGYTHSKYSIMGSVYQSMFHKDNFSKSVDIWTYDERNNDIYNAKAKSYEWFGKKWVHYDNQGDMGVEFTPLEELQEHPNDMIGVINNGAQMYRWKKYQNNLSYDQFKDVMRAWIGVQWTKEGRKTIFDQTPDKEAQMSYDLDNDMVNTFADLYLKGGKLGKKDRIKKIISYAFGSGYDINVVGSGTPQIASKSEGGSKELNKTSDDSTASTLSGSDNHDGDEPVADGAPAKMNVYEQERMEAYNAFNNAYDKKNANEVANEGTFNGTDVAFQSSEGENVKAFASGTVDQIGNNTLQINHKGAVVAYTNVKPDASLKKGTTVKDGQKVGEVSSQGNLKMSLRVPNGYEASLNINQNGLAHAVEPKFDVKKADKGYTVNNQVVEYDDNAQGQCIDPSVLYLPDPKSDTPDAGDGGDLLAEAEKWIGKLPYPPGDYSHGTGVAALAAGHKLHEGMEADCSGYVWAMMKLSGYKVDAPFNTWSMEADAKGAHHWFKQISQKDTRAGDIVVVNAGGEGHTAILREHFHGDPHSSGNTTKIVNDGGCENNANNNLFGRSFYPGCAGGRVTFMRPVSRHK